MPLSVILSEVSNANEAEGSRTGSRKRTRYRFLIREALTSYAKGLHPEIAAHLLCYVNPVMANVQGALKAHLVRERRTPVPGTQ